MTTNTMTETFTPVRRTTYGTFIEGAGGTKRHVGYIIEESLDMTIFENKIQKIGWKTVYKTAICKGRRNSGFTYYRSFAPCADRAAAFIACDCKDCHAKL